jgi:hypothetical protein
MAGQTNIFTWDIEAGTQGKTSTYETIQFLMENSEALSGGSEDMNAEDAEKLVELLVENLDQDSIDLLTAGTAMDSMTPSEIEAYLAANSISSGDIILIEANVEANQEAILEDALGDLEVTVEFTTKAGTLINGFGLGVYGNVYSILDAGAMGFENMIIETGVKGGYGFNLGPLALGFSADLAMVGDLTYYGSVSMSDYAELSNQMMVYGYAWGIDAGVTYEVFDWLSVGAVMTDIIGSYSPAGETTLEDFVSGDSGTSIPFDYSFDTDLDFGVTFTPQLGKLLKPSFSIDYYDFIELFRTPPENLQDVVDHVRLGASLELLTFINLRSQYYQEYFTVGAGVDLIVVEIFGEFLFKQTFDDIGGAVLVKLHL